MTNVVATTPASFFEEAFARISAFAREHRARRAQRIALATLMEMDASRLDDLGIDTCDVIEALRTEPVATRQLDGRRAQRAITWQPSNPVTA